MGFEGHEWGFGRVGEGVNGGGGEEEGGIWGDAFGVENTEVFGAWVDDGMGQ